MIIGIGNDIVNIARIESTLEKFDMHFINKIFADSEIGEGEYRAKLGAKARACSYAKKFAAKEACSKALGTGIRRGVFWTDMVVKHLPSGKPVMELKGGALKRAVELTPEGMKPVLHVTMTDDYPYAEAVVILEAV